MIRLDVANSFNNRLLKSQINYTPSALQIAKLDFSTKEDSFKSVASNIYFSGRKKTDELLSKTEEPLKTLSPQQRKEVKNYGTEYIDFLNRAVCGPWAVKTIIEEAENRGFKPFPEDGSQVKAGEKYYFNHNRSVALVVIGKNNPVKSGFNLIGAHVDVPQLKLKPNPIVKGQGVVEFKTHIHGGPTLISWFNRDLGIAGMVYEPVLDKKGKPKLDPVTKLPKQKVRYVKMDSPKVLIPLEAIHINKTMNRDGRPIKQEADLIPLAGTSSVNIDGGKIYKSISENINKGLKKHGIDLVNSKRAELYLYPVESASDDIGVDKTLIAGFGQDDHSLSFAAMKAIFEAAEGKQPVEKTSVAYFFDNEETGSLNTGGAKSQWTPAIISKILKAQLPELKTDLTMAREDALSKSFFLSADVTHGFLPQHAQYFDATNLPSIGQGPVIVADSKGAFATTAEGAAIVQDIASRHKIPVQVIAEHQDTMGGTTIGPEVAAHLNVRTVDIGIPLSSMHSTRETTAKVDGYLAKELFRHFFKND